MSQGRGKDLHREFPRFLTAIWPHAEACPPGRNGRDVLGTPGIAWEIKTAGDANYRPGQWVRQATRNAAGDIPIVAYYPQGVGIGSPERAIAMLPLTEVIALLVKAGYA